MAKFADDTTLGGCIIDNEVDYRTEVQNLVEWCSQNNLELNVQKTKEVIVDFRKNPGNIIPLTINNSEVEIVDSFKYLGVHISSDFKWETNVDSIVKKSQQRLFFLRRLRSFRVGQELLVKFYRAVIESVLTFSIIVWYGNATVADRRRLDRVVKTASKIIGIKLDSLDVLYNKRVLRKTRSIINDESHPAHNLFQLLPSGKRYKSISCNTNRVRDSFYPTAVRSLNKSLCLKS